MEHSPNPFELPLYYAGWIGINLCAFYKYFVEQYGLIDNNPSLLRSLQDIGPGWTFLSRPKDVFDVEWASWKHYVKISSFYILFQFVVSEIIRKSYPSTLKYWYILSSMIFVSVFMGLKQMIIILVQPIIFASIIYLGGNKIIIWITSIILLWSYNSLKYKHFFFYFLDHENLYDEEVYLLLYSIAWVELRCVSFCIDYVDKQEKTKSNKGKLRTTFYQHTIDMFSYVLYLPLLYLGPIMLYEDFEKSFHVKDVKLYPKLKRFTIDMVLYFIYSFLMDLAFHYIYFFALQERIEMIRQMSSLALCGGGLWMGFQFHLKYVISYGTTGAFARLDNLEPPPTPRCIARIHVYSQMWRYFDVGLYKFLLKYIYKPGYATLSQYIKLSKIMYKVLASFSTFFFIFMWHGTVRSIFIWTILNYIGILLEYSSKAISVTDGYKNFKKNWLKTEANETRFVAVLCSPLLVVSAISNFYLFGGGQVGDLFFSLLIWPAPYNISIVLIAVYCCSHVSMSLQHIPSRTDRPTMAKIK